MLFLTGSASAIGMGIRDVLLASPMPEVIGVWAGGLAAQITLAAVMGLWRSGRSSLGWFLGASVLIYLTAGLLAGAFARQLSAPAIPIMALAPLVYPVTGLIWGALLHQAASQGFIPFLS